MATAQQMVVAKWRDRLADGKGVVFHVASLLNGSRPNFLMGELHYLRNHEREEAKAVFKETLMGLIDNWIDSGKPRPSISESAKPRPDQVAVFDFWNRNKPGLIVELDGSLVAVLGPQPRYARKLEPNGIARDHAVFEYARLTRSPSPERLSRCDGCRKYFVRKRVPKKTSPVFHGTFCIECGNKGGLIRMQASRKKFKTDMVNAAASAWNEWKYSHRSPDQCAWVLSRINKKFERLLKNKLTKKWFTQNRSTILKKAEDLDNAKG